MKTTERIHIGIEHNRILEMGFLRCNTKKGKQDRAFIEIYYKESLEGFAYFNEEQLQGLLDGLTIVKNELHKRNSSKRQKKKKPAPKPKKEIEVQMFLVNPIPIL